MRKKIISLAAAKRNMAIELSKQYPGFRFINNFLGFCFLLGLGLIVWEIQIFQHTFIPPVIPFAIGALTGIFLTPLLKKTLNIYIVNPYSPGRLPLIAHLLYNICAWGGMAAFIFMWINFNFADPTPRDLSLDIQSYGHHAPGKHDCGTPYVMVTYKDQIKELEFPCGAKVETNRIVHLHIAKGFFGFDIIKDQTLGNDY